MSEWESKQRRALATIYRDIMTTQNAKQSFGTTMRTDDNDDGFSCSSCSNYTLAHPHTQTQARMHTHCRKPNENANLTICFDIFIVILDWHRHRTHFKLGKCLHFNRWLFSLFTSSKFAQLISFTDFSFTLTQGEGVYDKCQMAMLSFRYSLECWMCNESMQIETAKQG